jgi:hypothetical protein
MLRSSFRSAAKAARSAYPLLSPTPKAVHIPSATVWLAGDRNFDQSQARARSRRLPALSPTTTPSRTSMSVSIQDCAPLPHAPPQQHGTCHAGEITTTINQQQQAQQHR